MSTRSNIILWDPDSKKYKSVYCHSDGYLSYNGRILCEYYDTYEKVAELIDLGDLSYLAETPDQTRSYHRWRGEDKNIRVSNNLSGHFTEEYGYLFKDGAWTYTDHGRSWEPLTKEVCEKD